VRVGGICSPKNVGKILFFRANIVYNLGILLIFHIYIFGQNVLQQLHFDHDGLNVDVCGLCVKVKKNENDESFARGQHCQDMLDNLLSVQSVIQQDYSTQPNINHCTVDIPSFNGIQVFSSLISSSLLTYLLTYLYLLMPCSSRWNRSQTTFT